jgi:AcrR family transcriptional regulator
MSNQRISTQPAVGRPSVAVERREQILDAVTQCLIEVGLVGTTLEAIAKRAGMTRSAIAHFVGNRDDVIAAAVTKSIDQFVNLARLQVQEVPPEQRLDSFVDFVLESNEIAGIIVVIDELTAHAHHDEHAREELRSGYGRLHGFVEQMAADRYPRAAAARRSTAVTGLILVLREYDRLRALGATDSPDGLHRQVGELTTMLLESMDD